MGLGGWAWYQRHRTPVDKVGHRRWLAGYSMLWFMLGTARLLMPAEHTVDVSQPQGATSFIGNGFPFQNSLEDNKSKPV